MTTEQFRGSSIKALTGTVLLGFLWAGTGPTTSRAAEAAEEEEETRNWIEFSVGGTSVRENDAQFSQRHGLPADSLYGGIEDFHYEQFVGKKGLFTVDGRSIYNHDHLFKIGLESPDVGYVRFGYQEFRTWYDGSGGYYPFGAVNNWFNPYDDEMHLDRGELWFEAGLTRPDQPKVTFRYGHQFRDGLKDSTSWGDTSRTVITPALGTITRKNYPTFLNIDEKRDIFELDVAHVVGKTDWGLGLRAEFSEQDNSRNERRNIGQSNDRFITQHDKADTDLYNAHGYTITRFNDEVMLTVGGSFTRLDTDVGGSRIFGSDYDAVYDPGFPRSNTDHGFIDLTGGSQLDQYVATLNLMVTPCAHLTIVPSLRIENQCQDGTVSFIETAGPATAPLEEDFVNTRNRDFLDVTESLEARYTGVTNWAFYVRGEWLQGDGTLGEAEIEEGVTAIARNTDSSRFTQKYVAGANWYPIRRANFSAQYYHKKRENDYDHMSDSTPNAGSDRYPAYLVGQDFTTDDVNFRMTLRPHSSVTLISRYDFQLSTIDTRADLLASVESAEMTSHIFNQSITWTPWSRLYLQANGTYAFDELESPSEAVRGTGAAATTSLVTESQNGYWSASVMAGFVLDDKTDLQLQYNYYQADNYINNARASQPYGAEGEEHGITATLIRQLRKNLRLKLQYGYFTYEDVTSGGNNDFAAHTVYSSLQYRF